MPAAPRDILPRQCAGRWRDPGAARCVQHHCAGVLIDLPGSIRQPQYWWGIAMAHEPNLRNCGTIFTAYAMSPRLPRGSLGPSQPTNVLYIKGFWHFVTLVLHVGKTLQNLTSQADRKRMPCHVIPPHHEEDSPCGRRPQHPLKCAAVCPQTLSRAGSAQKACCLALRATPSAHPCAAQSHMRLPAACRARRGHHTAAASHQSELLQLHTSCGHRNSSHDSSMGCCWDCAYGSKHSPHITATSCPRLFSDCMQCGN